MRIARQRKKDSSDVRMPLFSNSFNRSFCLRGKIRRQDERRTECVVRRGRGRGHGIANVNNVVLFQPTCVRHYLHDARREVTYHRNASEPMVMEEEDASTITISDCGQNGKPKRALKGLARRISRARRVWHCAAGESASGIGRRHDKVTDTD